jgi:hypothetical protein
MKGISGEKLSQLAKLRVRVVQVVDIGLTSFTIGRVEDAGSPARHVVHALGSDLLTFFPNASAGEIAAAIRVGYLAREREPQQLAWVV